MVLLFVNYHHCNIPSGIISAFLIQNVDSDLPPMTLVKATERRKKVRFKQLPHIRRKRACWLPCRRQSHCRGSNQDKGTEVYKEDAFPGPWVRLAKVTPNRTLESMPQGADSWLWKSVQHTNIESYFKAECSSDNN